MTTTSKIGLKHPVIHFEILGRDPVGLSAFYRDIFGWATKEPMAGDPMLLVLRGHFVEEHLTRVGMTEADVMAALRERGIDCLEQVRFAVLELDGSVNVVTEDRKGFRTRRDVREPDEHRRKRDAQDAEERQQMNHCGKLTGWRIATRPIPN